MGLASPARPVSTQPFAPPSLLSEKMESAYRQADQTLPEELETRRLAGDCSEVVDPVTRQPYRTVADAAVSGNEPAEHLSPKPAGSESFTSAAGSVPEQPKSAAVDVESRAPAVSDNAAGRIARETIPVETLGQNQQAVSAGKSLFGSVPGARGTSPLSGDEPTLPSLPFATDAPLVRHRSETLLPPTRSNQQSTSLRTAQAQIERDSSTTEIHVTIGRVEVTAVSDQPQTATNRPAPNRRPAPMSLEEYLAKRQRRRV